MPQPRERRQPAKVKPSPLPPPRPHAKRSPVQNLKETRARQPPEFGEVDLLPARLLHPDQRVHPHALPVSEVFDAAPFLLPSYSPICDVSFHGWVVPAMIARCRTRGTSISSRPPPWGRHANPPGKPFGLPGPRGFPASDPENTPLLKKRAFHFALRRRVTGSAGHDSI